MSDATSSPPANRRGPRKAAAGNRLSHPRSKISFGVILTRINEQTRQPEAVLVRSRYSYEYAEFVHGRYARKNIRAISALLDAMSVDERLIIYSLDFSQMWYRIWLTADRKELYNKKLAKFQSVWMSDDSGAQLRNLIKNSRTDNRESGLRWEFPKGKKLSNEELDINCAIREFQEEAGIVKRDYQILPGIRRRNSFVHANTRYINVYYVALVRRNIKPKIDLKDLDQVAEVSEVRWMNIEQIRLFDNTGRLEKTVLPVFRYVKQYVRGRVPVRSLFYLSRRRPASQRGAPRRRLEPRDFAAIGVARQRPPKKGTRGAATDRP